MKTALSRIDRVLAALRGGEVDRVPVSAWWHDFAREWSPEGLAEATLEAYRKFGWDFIKVNPRATYYAEDWGARFRASPDRQPELLEAAVRSAEDLARIQPLAPAQGAYSEQLAALAIIARDLAGEAPFIQTVFSPLAVMSRLTGSTRFVQRLIAEQPDALLAALDAVAQTLAAYARACLDVGAAGVFFATVEWGSGDNISPQDYDRFARPFDLRVLEAVRDAPFNVLHVCRDNNHLLRLLDYPVAAFHWDVTGAGNPTLAEVAARTDRALMGGVSHQSTMASGSPEDVAAEGRRAVAETGGRRFLLAPGCSIDPGTPEANLRALVEAARL
ncbi:MAG TPA: uroporphyrinogen decarboxylase family protein [Dehalococcoidia bacterium]|nr:uroporphyrinogen decarboxylase family protein [Dehalococcoidia bacterium]